MAWLDNTQGLIEPEEGRRLATLASWVPRNQAIVEVGSHTGLSTCWLAAGSRSGLGAHIIAVDPWPAPRPGSLDDPWELGPEGVLQRFKDNVAGVTQDTSREDYGDLITAIRIRSEELAACWVKPIGLLFVDAVHEEAAVKADYAAWSSHVADDGVIAFHDYGDSYPGCKRGIDYVAATGLWEPLGVVGSLWVGRRT
jgi:hypothetical protein